MQGPCLSGLLPKNAGWAEARSPTDPILIQNNGVDVFGLLGFAIKPLSPTYVF
jgi:hypothetical protein